MEEVNGTKLNTFPLKDLIKVSDLIYYDGPLLTHFQTRNRDNYLFYWVDVDSLHNRWLVVRTSLDKLQAFVNRKIPLFAIITEPDDNFLFKVDITEDVLYENIVLLLPNQIPESYIPSKESFYDHESEQDLDLSIYSERYQSGILQAYYKNSTKVGYNEINLEIFGPSLNNLNELTIGLGKAFLKHKITTASKDKNGKPLIDKSAVIGATKLKYFANAGGSFSALFKSASTQVGLPGVKTDQDEFIEYVLRFMSISEHYEEFSKYVEALDKGIVNSYKSLLQNIVSAKLQFYLKWENSVSNVKGKKEIDFRDASKILDNLEKLEYDDKADVRMTGRFTMVNLRSGSYEFHNIEDEQEASKGKFDSIRFEMAWQIKFTSYYEIIISRQESKQAGNKKPKVSDILTSFIEIQSMRTGDQELER